MRELRQVKSSRGVVDSVVPNLMLLFGISGAGKTFVGDLVSKRLGYFQYELDRDLTPAMRAAIAAQRSFTERERDEYFDLVTIRIHEISARQPKTVFTQGVYKERHRELLRQRVPGLETVWIKAPLDVVQDRLRAREGGVSPDYADIIARNFEAPRAGLVLLNDQVPAEELWHRFVELFPQ